MLTWKACDGFKNYTVNPFSANLAKWSNTLEQFIGNLPTNCLSVFDHFVILALKGLKYSITVQYQILSMTYRNMVFDQTDKSKYCTSFFRGGISAITCFQVKQDFKNRT